MLTRQQKRKAEAAALPPAGRGRRVLGRRVRRQGHYGSNSDEIDCYIRDSQFRENVLALHPQGVGSKTISRKKLDGTGELIIIYNKGSHWQCVDIDFPNKVIATMGMRLGRIPLAIRDLLAAHGLSYALDFEDITPPVGAQTGSECGARVAVYCRWFGATRTPERKGRHELDTQNFRREVADLMELWRAQR
jgi:hypothetical protein